MSATTVSQTDNLESEYLKALKFAEHDSFIERSFDPATPLDPKDLPTFLDESNPRARLIFCSDKEKAYYKKECGKAEFTVEVNCEDNNLLSQI